MISDKVYRLLLSSGITFGGVGLAWILMKVIVPSKEEMLKVLCEAMSIVKAHVNLAIPTWTKWKSGDLDKKHICLYNALDVKWQLTKFKFHTSNNLIILSDIMM